MQFYAQEVIMLKVSLKKFVTVLPYRLKEE